MYMKDFIFYTMISLLKRPLPLNIPKKKKKKKAGRVLFILTINEWRARLNCQSELDVPFKNSFPWFGEKIKQKSVNVVSINRHHAM